MSDNQEHVEGRDRCPHAWPFLGAAAAIFYLVTFARNRIETDDGFRFAEQVESAHWVALFDGDNVRHLFFLPFSRLLYELATWTGMEVRAYEVMRTSSSLAAGAAVVLMGIVLQKRFQTSHMAAFLSAVAFGTSYGFWRYANEAEVYSFSALAVLALIWLTLGGRVTLLKAGVIGAAAAVAIGVHVLNIVPALIFVPWVLIQSRCLRGLGVYAATVFIIVGGAYMATYHYVDPPARSFVDYVGRTDMPFAYDGKKAARAVVGAGQSVVAGNFVLAFEPVANRLEMELSTRGLNEERFAAERAPPALPLLAVVTLMVLGAATITLLSQVRPRVGPRLVGVILWMVVYAVVVLGQEPADLEPWVPLLPAFWILLGAGIIRMASASQRRSLVVALVLLLFTHNLVGGFLVLGGRGDDLNARRSDFLVNEAGPSDVVLTAGLPTFVGYLSYHTEAQVVRLQSIPTETLEATFEAIVASAEVLYVTEDIFDLPAQVAAKDPDTFQALKQFARRVRPDFIVVDDSGTEKVYRHMSP